jgi:tetratricopeptide (TPR) repeat protein
MFVFSWGKMNISSDIERLLAGSANLSIQEQIQRGNLCLESRQMDHAEALFCFIKAKTPEDHRAYIGLARTCAAKRRFEEALLELAEARGMIARGPITDEGMDDFLSAYHEYCKIEQIKKPLTDFRRLIYDGLKLRTEGSHDQAERVFREAIQKAGTLEEAEEARFYTVTLYKLPNTIIEQRLRGLRVPKFFNKFPEAERGYLRKQFVRISDKYLPWETDEDLMKFHAQRRKPFSSEDAEALKNINSPEDLGI